MSGGHKGLLLLRQAIFRVLDVPRGFQRDWEKHVFKAARVLIHQCKEADLQTLEKKLLPEFLTKELVERAAIGDFDCRPDI
eukprot:12924304-Prorocentrum_lima.AAC.1